MKRGVVVFACLVAGAFSSVPGAFAGPLRTAIVDPVNFSGARQTTSFARARATGATIVRLVLNWHDIAPERRPVSFTPHDPADPAYRWGGFDVQVRNAVRAGLQPLVTIQYAPAWAEGVGAGKEGTVRPDPDEFGLFARAAARRYSGSFQSDPYTEALPRIRYWQAWNEPNRDYYFMPQYEGGRMVSPDWYRRLVNKFTSGVKAVHATNYVVAGGLAPLSRPGKPGPLPFMRALLSQPIAFDIWAHHPYTSGGPTHNAPTSRDVSLGDLPEMRRVLRSGIRSGNVRSAARVGFWVTEFSWDSSPPDPRALRAPLHARWVSEALYRMWKNGVGVVTWYRIQDDPLRASPYQSGFFRTNGRRKLSFQAFRFPVVAFTRRGGVYVWGRTPTGRGGRVTIELKAGRGWRRLGIVRANGYGIFQRTYRTPVRRGFVRARFRREASLPFSLTRVRDRYVNPFGCGGITPCW